MKKLVFGLATSVLIAATCFAGTETYSSGKTSKEYKQVEKPTCFADRELQLDVFGAYQDGNSPNHAGPIKDHAWGGGVAVNYFFMRYFGLSAEGYFMAGHDGGTITPTDNKTQFSSATGSLIFRYPIDSLCLAPYLFVGGGGTWDGAGLGLGHVGVGLEYRIVPNKVGLFADARWNYYGDRDHHDVQNNFLVRAGVRWVF